MSITENDLKPDTLSKQLTLASLGCGTLGAILFIISKGVGKYKFLSSLGKALIGIGIYLLAIAVYFLKIQNSSPI